VTYCCNLCMSNACCWLLPSICSHQVVLHFLS
jgi:hypothetical protein